MEEWREVLWNEENFVRDEKREGGRDVRELEDKWQKRDVLIDEQWRK